MWIRTTSGRLLNSAHFMDFSVVAPEPADDETREAAAERAAYNVRGTTPQGGSRVLLAAADNVTEGEAHAIIEQLLAHLGMGHLAVQAGDLLANLRVGKATLGA